MDIDFLARKAIGFIKDNYGIPLHGLIAGGSIGNLIWEFVSGNKAIINDIDVFLFNGITDDIHKDKSIFSYVKNNYEYFENEYLSLDFNKSTDNFYYINECTKEGIFNYINYKSKTDDKSIIIESFDINSTRISYDIDNDTVFWTPDFEEFLKTGELKVSNLLTPNHTAIRIAKKSVELNANVDELEYKLLQYSSYHSFNDRIKIRFLERYYDLYKKYEYILYKYFEIQSDEDTKYYLKNTNELKLYLLQSKDYNPFNLDSTTYFKNINSSDSFLFYIRNIYGNKDLEIIWEKLYFYLNDEINYIDIDLKSNIEDIKLLSNVLINAPNSIEKLRGYKLSEQILIVKKLLESFKDNPNIAIALLEKIKINKNMDFSDPNNLLIMELIVRKESQKNQYKIDKIFSNEEFKNEEFKNDDIYW